MLMAPAGSLPKVMPPKSHDQLDDAHGAQEQARDARKPKKKGQEQQVAAADAATAAGETKDCAVAADLRRAKTAGEALLRPSATDGLIARASKNSTPSLIDKNLTVLRRTRGAAGAEGGCAKGQDEIDRILKDAGYDSDEARGHGEIVPLNNMQASPLTRTLLFPMWPLTRLQRHDPTLSLMVMQRKLLQRGIGIELIGMPSYTLEATIQAWSAMNAPRHITHQHPAFMPPS